MSESQYQNIVIVGASGAGKQLANYLTPQLPTTHRILLIDALDFGFWPLGALRAAVVPGWENRITGPLNTSTVFPADVPHEVIAPNKVLELKAGSVVLEKPFEGSTEVPFFKCILCMGAQQPAPMRPEPDSTEEQYKQLLRGYQADLAKAKKVVIVGGGAVGLEMAGEIRAVHPNTAITIVHALDHVLNPSRTQEPLKYKPFTYSDPPTTPKLSTQLESALPRLKIDVVLSDRVHVPSSPAEAGPGEWDGTFGLTEGGVAKKVKLEKSGKELEADFVFVSVGNKPNNELVKTKDAGAMVGDLVAVNEYLQVVSKTASSPFGKDYYAIGDVCSTPGWKTWAGADADAKACATNIIAEVRGKPLKAYNRPLPFAMFIPLGPKAGHGYLTLPFLGPTHVPTMMVTAAKAGDLLTKMLFFPSWKGQEKIPAAVAEKA